MSVDRFTERKLTAEGIEVENAIYDLETELRQLRLQLDKELSEWRCPTCGRHCVKPIDWIEAA